MFHFAAQVAVTTSLVDPIADFEVNARGTLNLLEAIRAPAGTAAAGLHLDQQGLRQAGRCRRWSWTASATRRPTRRSAPSGIDETAPARFLQPLWLLEGRRRPVRARLLPDLRPADGGVAHELHLRAAPVRHRGPGLGRAFPDPGAAGRADHALRRRLSGPRRPVRRRRWSTPSLLALAQHRPTIRGQAFNLGGGPANAVSLRRIARPDRRGSPAAGAEVSFGRWRPGDQLYYVSDTASVRPTRPAGSRASASPRGCGAAGRLADRAASPVAPASRAGGARA